MGDRGPVPKRSDQRRRTNKPDGGPVTTGRASGSLEVPEPDEGWHPMARDWFVSLAGSGQSDYYEPSDWQTARVWAEVLSRQLFAARISAQMIAAWASGATELLTTEGARRRGRLELERHIDDEDEDASVTALARYREQLGA
jgi:hypothetical protein